MRVLLFLNLKKNKFFYIFLTAISLSLVFKKFTFSLISLVVAFILVRILSSGNGEKNKNYEKIICTMPIYPKEIVAMAYIEILSYFLLIYLGVIGGFIFTRNETEKIIYFRYAIHSLLILILILLALPTNFKSYYSRNVEGSPLFKFILVIAIGIFYLYSFFRFDGRLKLIMNIPGLCIFIVIAVIIGLVSYRKSLAYIKLD